MGRVNFSEMISKIDKRAGKRWFPMKSVTEVDRVLRSKARFRYIRSGRRAYKSESCKRIVVQALAMDVGWDNPSYFYALPTRTQAKKLVWEDFKLLIPDPWIADKSETELWIRTIFGSRLEIVGLEKSMRLEGDGYNGGIIDERSDVRQTAIDISIMPALADRNGWLIQAGAAKRQGVGAADFNDSCDKAINCPHSEFFTWSSDVVLTPEQLDPLRATMDEKDFREQFEAEVVQAGGGVFYNWSAAEGGNVRPCPYDPTKQILVGSDFNVDPMSWVLGHEVIIDGVKQLHIFDEVWKRGTNTEDTLNALWRKYEDHESGWAFYGDATGDARHAHAAISSLMQIKNDQRFDKYRTKKVSYPKGNPKRVRRVQSCTSLIKSATGVRRLFVDPSCVKLIKDFKDRVYKEGSNDFDDGKFQGHITDAIGYLIHARYPYKLETGNYAAPVVMSGS